LTGIAANFLKLLAGGFIMGWGPCLAYTAPLLLPYVGGIETSWRGGLRIGVMFSLGRLVAVGILGGVATIAFSTINRFFPPHRSGYLYLVTALFIVAVGVLIIFGKGFRLSIGTIGKRSMLDRDSESMLLIGLLIGFSPCAPLIAVLTYIACIAENNVVLGIFYAAAFGISAAVAPLVLCSLMGILPETLFRAAKVRRIFQTVCGLVLILFGLQLIYYVLHLIA